MKPTLTIEALTELTPSDLALVVGAQTLTGLYPTGPIRDCIVEIVTILPDPA
ncbi:MAG TPA: hypothetical protein VF519_02345 [Mycobacteriales bacterium]|jgi:hypothetical protein